MSLDSRSSRLSSGSSCCDMHGVISIAPEQDHNGAPGETKAVTLRLRGSMSDVLRGYYAARGIVKNDHELGKVVSFAVERGLSTGEIVEQLDLKYGGGKDGKDGKDGKGDNGLGGAASFASTSVDSGNGGSGGGISGGGGGDGGGLGTSPQRRGGGRSKPGSGKPQLRRGLSRSLSRSSSSRSLSAAQAGLKESVSQVLPKKGLLSKKGGSGAKGGKSRMFRFQRRNWYVTSR